MLEMKELDGLVEEARWVYGFVKDVRPQERAHVYLEKHKVRRWYSDTALECVAVDLIERAYKLGGGCEKMEALDDAVGRLQAIRDAAQEAIDALEEG